MAQSAQEEFDGPDSAVALSYRRVLRLPNMAQLIVAAFFSRLAAEMMTLVFVLYTIQQFDSASLAGVVAFLAFAPGFVVSPIAGAFLDRFGSVSALVVDLVLSAAVVALTALAQPLGFLSPQLLLTVAFLYSLTSPLSLAGVRTLIPRLVPRRALDRANALDTSVFGVAEVLGPVAAGALMSLLGGSPTLTVVSVLYLVSVVALVPLLRSRPARDSRQASSSLLRESARGVVYVVRHRVLRGLAVSYSLYMVSWGIFVVVTPVLLAEEFGKGDADLMTGVIWAAMGVIGAVGALVAGRLSVIGREHRIIGIGLVLMTAAFVPGIAGAGVVALAVALLTIGAFGGPIDVSVLTLRQRMTDPARLGQVLAVSSSINMSGLPVGAAIGGLLAAQSLEAAFAVACASTLVAAVFGSALLSRSRSA
ncbi:Predicted arabinose efflux permease, MFS family [Sinosporangium album]|uniref:Predicted arabinose efflux permease, MFS family n=1 Tax=Sinosporangium album TaxID=504805 RepID=A0A1G7QUS7_9ACTN|nr:MFS transporter [Sinosporangium album]SDG02276.1 Predicted arabinose efflux permease, MFS family [Sinosporangium album]